MASIVKKAEPPVKRVNEKELRQLMYLSQVQGYESMRRQQYGKAIKAFDFALRYEKNNRQALLGRIKAKSNHFQHDGALADANQLLSLNKRDIRALSGRAQAEDNLGEFEKSCVDHHKGLRRRTCPHDFDTGVMTTTETIEDCIGRNVGNVMVESIPTIQALTEHKRQEAERLEQDLSEPEDMRSEAEQRRSEQRKMQMDRHLTKKYLGRLGEDKFFLQSLRFNSDLDSANKEGSEALKRLVDKSYNLLHEQQEILRTRMPYYAKKFREATISETLRKRQAAEAAERQYLAEADARRYLNKLREAREEGDLKKFLEVQARAIGYFEGQTKKTLVHKQEYLDGVYNITALTFLDMRRIKPERTDRENDRHVHFDFGLPFPGATSADDVIQPVRMPIVDLRKNIAETKRRVSLATQALEKAWVYHELARLYWEFVKLNESRQYARKCISEAKELNNAAWCINAGVILAKIEIFQRNKTEARNALVEAVRQAKGIKDENVTKYLNTAISAVDASDLDDIKDDAIAHRQSLMVKLAPAEMRSDMDRLLRGMSAVSSVRRMSVMPGVPVREAGKKIALDIPIEGNVDADQGDGSEAPRGRRKSVKVNIVPSDTDIPATRQARKSVKLTSETDLQEIAKVAKKPVKTVSTPDVPDKPMESAINPGSVLLRRRSVMVRRMSDD